MSTSPPNSLRCNHDACAFLDPYRVLSNVMNKCEITNIEGIKIDWENLPQDIQNAISIDFASKNTQQISEKIQAYVSDQFNHFLPARKAALEGIKSQLSSDFRTETLQKLAALSSYFFIEKKIDGLLQKHKAEKYAEAANRIWKFLGDQDAQVLDLYQLDLTALPPIFSQKVFLNKLGSEGLRNVRLAPSYKDDRVEIIHILKEWVAVTTNEKRESAAQKILDFLDSPDASELDLCNHDLTTLPEVFHRGGLPGRIKNVNLNQNQFVDFPSQIFHLKSLEILQFNNNFIRSIPGELTGFEHLNVAYFSNCGLTEVPPVFYLMSSLIEIDISCNHIYGVFSASEKHRNLVRLYLEGNFNLKLTGQRELISLRELCVEEGETIPAEYMWLPVTCNVEGFSDEAVTKFAEATGGRGPQFIVEEEYESGGESSDEEYHGPARKKLKFGSSSDEEGSK